MAHFLKVFLITLCISTLIFGMGVYTYLQIFNPIDSVISEGNGSNIHIEDGNVTDDNEDNLTPFEKAKKESNIINVLVVGTDKARTDTIIVASFNRDTKKTNLISVPRDTYYKREGYTGSYLKINAIYQDENIDGLVDAVEDIMSINIHKYVILDYQAVVESVDLLGGIQVDIPYRMLYHDMYDDPPLVIDFQPGTKLLNGEEALKYLRFRQNDDGSVVLYDIGRIEKQQEFLKLMIKKALSFKLLTLINQMYSYVDTNFSLSELIALSSDLIGFSMDNLETYALEGESNTVDGISFYFINEEKTLNKVYEIYGVYKEMNN